MQQQFELQVETTSGKCRKRKKVTSLRGAWCAYTQSGVDENLAANNFCFRIKLKPLTMAVVVVDGLLGRPTQKLSSTRHKLTEARRWFPEIRLKLYWSAGVRSAACRPVSLAATFWCNRPKTADTEQLAHLNMQICGLPGTAPALFLKNKNRR